MLAPLRAAMFEEPDRGGRAARRRGRTRGRKSGVTPAVRAPSPRRQVTEGDLPKHQVDDGSEDQALFAELVDQLLEVDDRALQLLDGVEQ